MKYKFMEDMNKLEISKLEKGASTVVFEIDFQETADKYREKRIASLIKKYPIL